MKVCASALWIGLLFVTNGFSTYANAIRVIFRDPLPTGKRGRPLLVPWPRIFNEMHLDFSTKVDTLTSAMFRASVTPRTVLKLAFTLALPRTAEMGKPDCLSKPLTRQACDSFKSCHNRTCQLIVHQKL